MSFVIGLTGMASSGKGEVSGFLVEKYDFKKLVFSDILKEEANKQGLLENKNYEEQKYIFSQIGLKMREESGRWDILALKLVEKIKNGNIEKVVVDGFRSVEEVKMFRENFEGFKLVFIDTDDDIRLERRKKEDPSTIDDDFKKRDRENIEHLGLEKVLDMADYTIVNNEEGLENLHKKIKEFVEKLDH